MAPVRGEMDNTKTTIIDYLITGALLLLIRQKERFPLGQLRDP